MSTHHYKFVHVATLSPWNSSNKNSKYFSIVASGHVYSCLAVYKCDMDGWKVIIPLFMFVGEG